MSYKNLHSTNIKEYTVTELSSALKKTIEINFDVVHVRGEVSGLIIARSGHIYFSLKDDNNIIQAVLWARVSQDINLKLEDGMEVVVIGKLSTYAPQSRYNIIVNSIELAGEGALLKLIEDRKRRLASEGLFDEKYKKTLPYLPNTIGVITSESGAAFQDIIIRIKERFPVNIILFPVLVQGNEAPKQIAQAINKINLYSDKNIDSIDLLIVGRGGGSFEDLMAFNEEIVVRAIFESKIPIISAVGHEIDNSLSDYVADKRAPTPTAAAEIALPDRKILVASLESISHRLLQTIKNKLDISKDNINKYFLPASHIFYDTKIMTLDIHSEKLKNKINVLIDVCLNKLRENKIEFFSPSQYCSNQKNNLIALNKLFLSSYKNLINIKISDYENNTFKLEKSLKNNINKIETIFNKSANSLDLLSYNKVLDRGFVLIKDNKNKTIKRAKQIINKTNARIQFFDGVVDAVLNKNNND